MIDSVAPFGDRFQYTLEVKGGKVEEKDYLALNSVMTAEIPDFSRVTVIFRGEERKIKVSEIGTGFLLKMK